MRRLEAVTTSITTCAPLERNKKPRLTEVNRGKRVYGLLTGQLLNHSQFFNLLGKSLTGNVQTSLDCAQRRFKLICHFQQ